MKKTFLRTILLMLTFSICLASAACGNKSDNNEDTTNSDTPSIEDNTATEDTSSVEADTTDDTSSVEDDTTEDTSSDEEDTAEDTSSDEEDTAKDEETENSDPRADLLVDTKWDLGYVGSYLNTQSANSIAKKAENYSYTDVFTIPKAGTTVTFAISADNTDGTVEPPSTDIYVISQWKQENGEWVIIPDGANYIGENTESPILSYSSSDVLIYSYTTSLDNENLRVCYRSGQTDSFTPKSFPKIYAEYTGKEGTKLPTNYEVYYNNLTGVTISAVGDSYFDGVATNIGQENIWVNMLAEKYEMTYKVDGVGGATVADARKDRVPVCERYQNILADSDIVLLEGGRNDYNISGVKSNITLPDSVKQEAANKGVDIQVPLGDIDSTDIQTFMGAWNVIIEGAKEKCPNAMIVIISPWNFSDKTSKPITRSQYINAMKQLAKKHGVYFIDASNTELTGVNMQSAEFRAEYCIAENDESHLNAKGMAMVMSKFEKIISEYYSHFLAKDTAGLNRLITNEDIATDQDIFMWVWDSQDHQ